MKNQLVDEKKLKKKTDIIQICQQSFGEDNVYLVSCEGINKKVGRKWTVNVLNNCYDKKMRYLFELKSRVYFSYVKFCNAGDGNESCGIAGCRSQFNKRYSSDVRFYDIISKKSDAAQYMLEHGMKWDKSEILLIKNKDASSLDEAKANEKWLQRECCLFD